MDIVKELEELNINKSKLKKYKFEIKILEDILNEDVQQYIEHESDIIQGMNYKCLDLENIIKSNIISNKTQDIALKYKDYKKQKESRIDIIEKIKTLESRARGLERKIKYIEQIALDCLSREEKFIIVCRYIENPRWQWSKIRNSYPKNFGGDYREIRTLHTMREIALIKIEEFTKDSEF